MSTNPQWAAQLALFIATGKCTKEFLDALGTSTELQKACDVAFSRQVDQLREELIPSRRSGAELMAALFTDIEHGDANHRAWLKGKLTAWAPRVVDATEVAAIRRAAENVLDCAKKHPDRLECCYAMDALLQDALDNTAAGKELQAELAQAKVDVERARRDFEAYKAKAADLLQLDMTRIVDPEFLELRAKIDQMRAVLKIHEPHRSVCSCGLVCSNPTLLGHLRDNPDHRDASPRRVADMP
jgi:hypothetical protein